MLRRFLCWTALALQAIAAAQQLPPERRQLNIESFEQIWRTVRDTHWDPKIGGLDWQGVHDELRPAIEKAATMEEARGVMSAMLARLKDSHFGLLPSDVYDEVGAPEGGSGETGIDVRVIDGKALVRRIDPGSPAEKAGVRRGWQILQAGGSDLAPTIERVEAAYRDSTLLEMRLARAAGAKLTGAPGGKIAARFLDEAGKTVDLEIGLAEPRGERAQFGHLPPQRVWIESRALESGVGYIAFNLFLDPERLMTEFERAIRSFVKAPGIVIDLRGNPGGIGLMAMGMAGWFIDQPDQPLGTMRLRQAELRFVVNPRLPAYRGKLAILVDGASASTSEIFAGGLQDLGRARIFGGRTAGAALPSFVEKLPNGDGFQCATADYVSAGGKRLEGRGVIPDVAAPLTREALLAGNDPALDAALHWIQSP